jgi:hypothetical protein
VRCKIIDTHVCLRIRAATTLAATYDALACGSRRAARRYSPKQNIEKLATNSPRESERTSTHVNNCRESPRCEHLLIIKSELERKECSDDVRQSSVWRGRPFNSSAILFICCWGYVVKSMPFGSYERIHRLMLSSVPRCHALRGSQQYTGTAVSTVTRACSPIS